MQPRLSPAGPPAPETRNPFRGKGLAVSVALLLEPGKRWSLGELARVAEVSRPMAGMVVRRLRTLGLVAGEVVQGRVAAVRPTPELFWETAAHWAATPVVPVVGGEVQVPVDRPRGGGAVIRATFGVPWEAVPRVYTRSFDALQPLLARSGGWWAGEQPADWEVAVVDFALPAGPVPPIVSALELATTPRGRETLAPHLTRVLDPFIEAGAA